MDAGASDTFSCRVYPGFNALYYSFYIVGLKTLSADSRVSYRRGGFPALSHHGLAVELAGDSPCRLFISSSDGPGMQQKAVDWCDVYGKANLDPSLVPGDAQRRCLAIGPSFPVRLWSPAIAWSRALVNFLRCRGRVDSPREHFANFRRQYRYRLPLAAYEPAPSEPDFIFFASTLWKKEPATNRFRAHFIEACKSLSRVRFEGGFIRRTRNDMRGFDALTVDTRYSAVDYLGLLKRSAVAFNTPAISSCHGWKLAEYLALGKAIIATPHVRALPAPLEHGVHMHYVDGSRGEIRAAVDRITSDDTYRRRLEKGARDYYLRYLTPTRVIERMTAAARRIAS